jgi:hypothetical protein
MRKFIAAAAFLAAQWQPAHAQAILGSIPEEFLGDWCSQEKTNGEEIFRPGACKLKPGSLSIDRMTLDTGRLSCVFESGTASDGNHPDADALHRYRGKATVDVRCPAQATAWQEDRTHHGADGLKRHPGKPSEKCTLYGTQVIQTTPDMTEAANNFVTRTSN